jgi:hypothetical protein
MHIVTHPDELVGQEQENVFRLYVDGSEIVKLLIHVIEQVLVEQTRVLTGLDGEIT